MVGNVCVTDFKKAFYAEDKPCHRDGGTTTSLYGYDLVLCNDDISSCMYGCTSFFGPEMKYSILVVDVCYPVDLHCKTGQCNLLYSCPS